MNDYCKGIASAVLLLILKPNNIPIIEEKQIFFCNITGIIKKYETKSPGVLTFDVFMDYNKEQLYGSFDLLVDYVEF